MSYAIECNFTTKLIEKESLAEYKGKKISKVVWDAEYDTFYHEDNYDDCTNCETHLESSKYHEDLEGILDSEAVTAIEDGLAEFISECVYHNKLKVKDDMVLLIEFTDWKSGEPTYRIITEKVV